MIETKKIQYKKAYVELYKMILNLPKKDYEKIPEDVLNNIKLSGDESYTWEYDSNKDFENQNLMVETKALFVQLYMNYLMNPSEKEKWEKYEKICKNMIEEEKNKQYDPSKIFETNKKEIIEDISETNISVSNDDSSQNKELMIIEEENFIQKISKMFKEIINRIFRKK